MARVTSASLTAHELRTRSAALSLADAWIKAAKGRVASRDIDDVKLLETVLRFTQRSE